MTRGQAVPYGVADFLTPGQAWAQQAAPLPSTAERWECGRKAGEASLARGKAGASPRTPRWVLSRSNRGNCEARVGPAGAACLSYRCKTKRAGAACTGEAGTACRAPTKD